MHRAATIDADTAHATAARVAWPSWVLGAALLVAVIAFGLHFSEERAFVRVAQGVEPWWLAVAVLVQAGTYVAQGGVWRLAARATGNPLSRRTAIALSLAKLFADQALPSAGLSSSILIAKALERRLVPPPAVKASVLINIASYHLAYVIALAAALAILAWSGQGNPVVVVTAVVFLLFSIGLSVAILAVAGRPAARADLAARRLRVGQAALAFVTAADGALVRSTRVLGAAIAMQGTIVLLDAATLWTLIAALGVWTPPTAVFASFMVASLFRTMGIVPGGLGMFEATSVLTLRLAGVDMAVALSATLLFRGLSFWLPMIPGYWFSRRALTAPPPSPRQDPALEFWSLSPATLLTHFQATSDGLSAAEAAGRLGTYGSNVLRDEHGLSRIEVFLRQWRSPLLLLLVFAAVASALTGEWMDAAIVLTIVIATVTIGYSREYRAQTAAAALRTRLSVRTMALRDGCGLSVPIHDIVPGDVVLLSAGSLVPADGVILEAADFYVNEAVLTGESYPVLKHAGTVPATAELVERTNCVFLGTNVCSGTAKCLIVHTGSTTEFGTIAHRLVLRAPETEFDRGVRRFGYFMTAAMLVMVLLVFAAHMFRGRPPVDTLLFSIALAVGLSPELLPAILSVNLARGAQMMARQGVLVRRLSAIENLGSMDLLCIDKTGTLTEGVVQVEGAYDAGGHASPDTLELGAWNAALETGVTSPLDDAIVSAHRPDLTRVHKVAEVPFDFVRKRVTVIVQTPEGIRLITKGAFHGVLEICSQSADGTPLDERARGEIEAQYESWTGRGIRVLAVASRWTDVQPDYGRSDERDMRLMGFITFLDRPREGVTAALQQLTALGVSVKLITGDSALVARHLASLVGLRTERIATGRDLATLNDEALLAVADRIDLFVEVDPNQKERIVLALKRLGHVVGFLGDGVNDAPAMHAADTSLSVESAVDVAREAADFVLLERGLDVIRRGIEEGRKTFANTLKYVLITTSANLGNMVSMAAASLFLPFLPLTAGQILLNNFLSDVPAVGLADDSVDPEQVDRPRRWDIRFIGQFMLIFGLVSAIFDFVTFGVLQAGFHARPELFRTAWFVESLLTELVVALVVRTGRPFYRSRPGRVLVISTVGLVIVAFAIPYLPIARVFGFVPLPGVLVAAIAGITVLYVAFTELTKRRFSMTGAQ
jgi:Mg2+-importing ATPase